MENKPQLSSSVKLQRQVQDTEIILSPQFEDLNNADTLIKEVDELKQDTDPLKQLKPFIVKPTDVIKPPEVALKINDEIYGTLGNFSMLIGKAKSRKSFCLTLFAGALLTDEPIYNTFKGCLPIDKRNVLFFDTEQAKYHVQLALNRICRLAKDENPINFIMHGLRSEPPKKRLELIETAIQNTPNLGFVFIDGVKDLITSINDEEQATLVSSKLLRWSEIYNIHIVVVLHQNKSDTNARGHIGTELQNKAETVISVTKDGNNKDISIVEAEQTRNKDFDTFAFEIIDNLPVLVEDYQMKTQSKSKDIDVMEFEHHKLFELFNIVYSQSSSTKIGYSTLRGLIQVAYQEKYKTKLANNRAIEILSIARHNNWIVQERERAPYTLGSFNNDI